MTPLSTLHPGTDGTLVSIDGERSFRRRLMELGFLPGAPLKVVRSVELGGLVELEVRGCRITVRRSEANHLLVAPRA